MICPNCGASNAARAIFCRRCHQRLPTPGLAAGVTYPRRRPVSSGGGRLPILAAILLAVVGLVIGALLVGLARPNPGSSPVAVVSPSPTSSLPIFVQPTPTPTPTPTPPPFVTFPPLPTPFPSGTPGPTPTVAPPTIGPTQPPVSPRPTPTPTPGPLTCANATDTPDRWVFVGTGNEDKTSHGWCLERATFRVVVGSMWGSADLLLSGHKIASYSCTDTTQACPDQTKVVAGTPRLAKAGEIISWRPTSCLDSTGAPCDPSQFEVTIQVGYEKATPQP